MRSSRWIPLSQPPRILDSRSFFRAEVLWFTLQVSGELGSNQAQQWNLRSCPSTKPSQVVSRAQSSH